MRLVLVVYKVLQVYPRISFERVEEVLVAEVDESGYLLQTVLRLCLLVDKVKSDRYSHLASSKLLVET